MLRAFFTAAVLFATVQAASAQTLYKEYDYGMARSKIAAMNGVYECDANFLCLADQTFQGEPVTVYFGFAGNGLNQVILDLTDSADPYNTILMSLLKSDSWRLLQVSNPTTGTSIDVVDAARRSDTQGLTTFETGALSAGTIGYTLIEYTGAAKSALDRSRNTGEAVLAVPEDTRFIDFVLNDPQETWYVNFYLAAKEVNAPAVDLESF